MDVNTEGVFAWCNETRKLIFFQFNWSTLLKWKTNMTAFHNTHLILV